MNELASHIIGVANREKIGITNLHLQLTLYFTLLFSLKIKVMSEDEFRNLYKESFAISDYGPRVKSVYDEYKGFNSSIIIMEMEPNSSFSHLDSTIIDMLYQRTVFLVGETHSQIGLLELGGKEVIEYTPEHILFLAEFFYI